MEAGRPSGRPAVREAVEKVRAGASTLDLKGVGLTADEVRDVAEVCKASSSLRR
jgi:hypothetical protein